MQHQVQKESLGTTASCDSMPWYDSYPYVWNRLLDVMMNTGVMCALYGLLALLQLQQTWVRELWRCTAGPVGDVLQGGLLWARRLGHGVGEQHHALSDGPMGCSKPGGCPVPGSAPWLQEKRDNFIQSSQRVKWREWPCLITKSLSLTEVNILPEAAKFVPTMNPRFWGLFFSWELALTQLWKWWFAHPGSGN